MHVINKRLNNSDVTLPFFLETVDLNYLMTQFKSMIADREKV